MNCERMKLFYGPDTIRSGRVRLRPANTEFAFFPPSDCRYYNKDNGQLNACNREKTVSFYKRKEIGKRLGRIDKCGENNR